MSEQLYSIKDRWLVDSREDLRILSKSNGAFYVYILCSPPLEQKMSPFYVGIGQNDRLFDHEKEAKLQIKTGSKVDKIRHIWDSNSEVVRVIDSFDCQAPFQREAELINDFGLLKDGTGILLNEQRYAPSHVCDGVELRKYAQNCNENKLPDNFIHRDSRLKVGPDTPKSQTSVHGMIYAVLEKNPGVKGSQLVEFLLEIDFSHIKSEYAVTGKVSRQWLAKYIDGGFYKRNRYIQKY